MDEDAGVRYYAALLASLISTLGWVGAIGGVVYTAYAFLFGSSPETAALLTGFAIMGGIVFARVEKTLYRVYER